MLLYSVENSIQIVKHANGQCRWLCDAIAHDSDEDVIVNGLLSTLCLLV